jgi:hypothetical protein
MITQRINDNLSAFFEPDDPVYKAFISDIEGVIPETVSKPTDIDIGALASQKEYLRRLSIFLVRQMYLDEAETVILEYVLNTFFQNLRLQNETDSAWVQRTIATVFNHKVSRATLIVALRPFSSREPIITNVTDQSAYGDFSYADVYQRADVEFEGETVFVFPAIAENSESSDFTIRVLLFDTPSKDIFVVKDILEKIVAAGITVRFLIQVTG